MVKYRPTWIPEGYQEANMYDLSGQTIIVFEDDNGAQLTFGYSKNVGYLELYVDVENAEVHQVEISGQLADLYSSKSNEDVKHLVWIDKNTDFVFFISANLSEDSLIKMAESVEAVQ